MVLSEETTDLQDQKKISCRSPLFKHLLADSLRQGHCHVILQLITCSQGSCHCGFSSIRRLL